jgi:photosystem II stability/assembly factor-like uncharacterized protein
MMLLSFAFGNDNLYKLKPSYMTVNGVSNTGLVVGNEEYAGPFVFWNPETDEVTNIGGLSAGEGVGGMARFSADGNYLSGSAMTTLPVDMAWQKEELSGYNYIFTSISFPGDGTVGYVAGQSSTYQGNGIVLITYDGGSNWFPVWEDTQNRGIESMHFIDGYTGYVCGWNGYFAQTTDGGYTWTTIDPTGGQDVYLWTSVVFKDENNGVIGGLLNDGIVVYYTSNGGHTWSLATGLSGAPSAIAYAGGDTYYLTTATGRIQKSTNNGQSWTDVYYVPMGIFLGMGFLNPDTGYVMGEGNIYHTTDGGSTWQSQSVGPDVIWQDIYYLDEQNIVICGTPDMIYESTDGGNTWQWANEATSNFEPGLHAIAKSGTKLFICGSGGTFYNRSTVDHEEASEMARYDVQANEWTTLGNLGESLEGNYSSGWTISADGGTVAGNAWKGSFYAHAVAWNAAEGFMDLGSLYPDDHASTRAEAVSGDGSIIVGYQDFNGPWKAAVWRKNPAGGYFPNVYLLFDPEGDPNDEENQLAMATAISSDGVWIGGQGDYVTNGQPWLWSENTGVVLLGTIDDLEGTVTGISHDGSVVVGFFGGPPWIPRVPFIWTRGRGIQNLNDYATQTLGVDMAGTTIETPMDLSDNGLYVVGMAFDPNFGEWGGESRAFRLQLGETSTPQDTVVPAALSLSRVYPNPFGSAANIEYKLEEAAQVKLSIYNQRGQLVRRLVSEGKAAGTHTVSWDGRDAKGRKVTNGIYFARLNSGKESSLKKLIFIAE